MNGEGKAAQPLPTVRTGATPLKKLERGWKSLWFRAIFRRLAGRPTPPLPDWRREPTRVLFIRPDGIGDAILSVRLFESVARVSPCIKVDVLASPANAALLRRVACINEVILFNRRERGALPRLARELRARRYDAVIDCRLIEPSLTGLLLMLASGAPHRFAIGSRGVDPALTSVAPRIQGHVTAQLALLGRPFGLSPEEIGQRPRLSLAPEEESWGERQWADGEIRGGKRLLVNVSAGEPGRAWEERRFEQVIRQCVRVASVLEVRIMGAPAERDKVRTIAQSVSAGVVETPTFGHVIGLVAAADVVFTPDTSIVHVASAFSKPTVALYLEGTSREWGAFDVPGANLESAGRTLASISVEDVMAVLLPLLDHTA